jgi:hypothetical protein
VCTRAGLAAWTQLITGTEQGTRDKPALKKGCWLAQRYDDTAGRPKRVHSKKEEHNCGVVGTHSERKDGDIGHWNAVGQ